MKIILYLATVIIIALTSFNLIMQYDDESLLILTTLFTVIGLAVSINLILSQYDIIIKIISLMFSAIILFTIVTATILPALMYTPVLIPIYIIGIISSITILIFENLLKKRNKFGTEILGKIRGFKRYLMTAEKEELEAKVLENPTYFYEILPYTYVLGVSNIWAEKFESIALSPPEWYVSSDPFTTVMLTNSLMNTYNRANSYMNSYNSNSSSGGSGFSGGGFSRRWLWWRRRRLLVII